MLITQPRQPKSEMKQLSLGLINQQKGEKLFEEVYALKRLELAFKKVKANGGSAGPDGESVEEFDEKRTGKLAELQAELKSRSYQPQPVRRVSIPKPNGGERLLGNRWRSETTTCMRSRVRTRTHGSVGGRSPNGDLLPDRTGRGCEARDE